MLEPPHSVLVTGVRGFIGGWAASAFSKAGWSVCGLARSYSVSVNHPARPVLSEVVADDLSDCKRLTEFLALRQTDLIVHLAGPADVPGSFANPAADFKAQVLPFLSVLEAVRLNASRTRVLLVSSAAVYGEPIKLPILETDSTSPISPYGWHKLNLEALLMEYGRLFGVSSATARLFSVYGEGQRRLAVWDLFRRALSDEPGFRGTGAETRDYLHVTDAADALLRIGTQAPFEGDIFNVASGGEVSIAALANEIASVVGGPASTPAVSGDVIQGAPLRWRANISRLQGLGFHQQTGLRDGLERTLAWIRAEA